MKTSVKLSLLLLFIIFSCSKNNEVADAYGNFQAKEITISSEVSGKVIHKFFEEGDEIKNTQLLAVIDTSQIVLQKVELEATRGATHVKKLNISAQLEVLNQQKKVAKVSQDRLEKMFEDGAATQKQLDDVNGQIEILDKQILSVQSNFKMVEAELSTIDAKEEKINDMLFRSKVYPPLEGTVLQSFIEEGELVYPGKPLLKMANLKSMDLKAYISGEILSAIKIGQQVLVKIDGAENELLEHKGTITWISPEAEFTPKNVQTRKERVAQVYAIKVAVENDGSIKINMPAEVYFN